MRFLWAGNLACPSGTRRAAPRSPGATAAGTASSPVSLWCMAKRTITGRHNSGAPTADLAVKWLLWGGALTTLFFWASLNDPFNAPKSWILSIASFWLLGWLLFQIKESFALAPLRWATLISGAYLLALTMALIATDNSYIGFFGDYQRRTGYLSYLSLIILFLASAYLVRLTTLDIVERVSLIVGFALGAYGFLQHFKHDFIHWNNSFNPVIATLGNPDFAGAVMAIFLVINFGILIQKEQHKLLRLFATFNALLLIVVIIFSQVRQALLTAAIGMVFVLIIWLHQRQKSGAYGLAGASILLCLLGIAGTLNSGPLAKYLYKVSVTYRGDYWRAGWRMFIHHPLFGVGLDRYGYFFRQYRDATQSLRRGPDITSNAAHNVPLQIAATGGVFALLAFLLLTGFIAWRGSVALRRTTGHKQILTAVIFAAWIAYELQSIISIDNLAIAVWGYILGGALVGMSLPPEMAQGKTVNRSSLQPFISAALALCLFVPSLLLLKSESAMNASNRTSPPSSKADFPAYEALLQKPLAFGFKEPQFQLNVAFAEARLGDFASAIKLLQEVIRDDPRNSSATETLARIYEYQSNWAPAIELRQKMVDLDPFNPLNLLQLGKDEKSSGNLKSAQAVIPLIDAFAPKSVEAKKAHADLGK